MTSSSRDITQKIGEKLIKARPMMLRIACHQLKSQAIAEEVVQEACMSAVRAYSTFDGRSTFSTWLIAILKRKIIDQIRKSKREIATESIDVLGIDPFEGMFIADGHWRVYPTQWPDPEAYVEREDFHKVLFDCIERLPERMGRVFMMREILGCDTNEICNALDINTSNCWVLLYRARMQLRACLNKNWFD